MRDKCNIAFRYNLLPKFPFKHAIVSFSTDNTKCKATANDFRYHAPLWHAALYALNSWDAHKRPVKLIYTPVVRCLSESVPHMIDAIGMSLFRRPTFRKTFTFC